VVIALADANGGIFKPNRMWSAIVDRKGQICSGINSGNGPVAGSRAIAIAKAGTANDFSNSGLPLSTANLYSATQPGGSLYGLNNSNPFNPDFLPQGSLNGVVAPDRVASNGDYWGEGGQGKVPGGIITFGGGVALYEKGQVIGGLGVSGDSSCADHAIAYRMGHLARADDGIPAGVGAGGTDNISYLSPGEAPNRFKQPHCFPTDITP
jgi:uncharacterized protein GlcG (DUF336 family)